jgi:hypothetical protein
MRRVLLTALGAAAVVVLPSRPSAEGSSASREPQSGESHGTRWVYECFPSETHPRAARDVAP